MKQSREPRAAACEITAQNALGLHARPAAQFAKVANIYRSEIWLIKDGRRYAGASLVDIMRANIGCGTTFRLEAHGVDADEAIARLAKLVAEFKDRDV